MIFIVRTDGAAPTAWPIKLERRTPALVAAGIATTDYFCVADTVPEVAGVVKVHDGWYADDTGGGVAVWGQGKFWEVRDTHFSVRESDDAKADIAEKAAPAEIVNVRGAIFGV